MGTGYTPIERKSFFREWIGWDTIVLLLILFGIVGFLFWNSNLTYPPREVAPVAEMDKYKIITSNGECWVVLTEPEEGPMILMEGDHLGECQMYLRNLKL